MSDPNSRCRIAPSWCVHTPHYCLVLPAGARRNGYVVFSIFKKMVFTHQGFVRPEHCQSGCEGPPSTD
ncbi:MAG: hypothetical protein ACU84H_14280 [Gammaproteobacteria bacterium]